MNDNEPTTTDAAAAPAAAGFAPPRNVPTLTEVMDGAPPAGQQAAAAHAPMPAAAPTPVQAAQPGTPNAPHAPATLDAAADALLARLGPQIEQEIAEAIGRVLHDQMLGFNARVRKAVAEVVRENIARAALHRQD